MLLLLLLFYYIHSPCVFTGNTSIFQPKRNDVLLFFAVFQSRLLFLHLFHFHFPSHFVLTTTTHISTQTPGHREAVCGSDNTRTFELTLSDWYHEMSEDLYWKRIGPGFYNSGYTQQYNWTRSVDGRLVSGELRLKLMMDKNKNGC